MSITEINISNIKTSIEIARKAVEYGNTMLLRNNIVEATTALGEAYAALHFMSTLQEYDPKSQKCYLVVEVLRKNAIKTQVDLLAGKIYSHFTD